LKITTALLNQGPTKKQFHPLYAGTQNFPLVLLSGPQKLLALEEFPAGKTFSPRPSIWVPRIFPLAAVSARKTFTICTVTKLYFGNYWLHSLTAHVI
jgi:hypothetical protein